MNSIVKLTIEKVKGSLLAYSKFIVPNDTGKTGSHQYGFYIHKNAWKILFDTKGQKGNNQEKNVRIKWQNDFETPSRFIYYGKETRNEYRITRFGKGFPFLSEDNIGNLLILVKISASFYEAFVLEKDQDIENFLSEFNISSAQTNALLPQFQDETNRLSPLHSCFQNYLKRMSAGFPPTEELAWNARNCLNNFKKYKVGFIQSNPDRVILEWLSAEFELFKFIENDRYQYITKKPFESVEKLINTANTILNRRKSRAGKSLEHHLTEIFTLFNFNFTSQGNTENRKKPDFIFPDIESYHSPAFQDDKLIFLAAKTTCKDRWRQILNEADRIKFKYLFTLQQGISPNQLKEMQRYNVGLVIPKAHLQCFPKDFRSDIMTLRQFTAFISSTQS